MARAIWNGKVIAESDRIEELEGDVYFPESSLKREYFPPQLNDFNASAEGPGAVHEHRD